jgi:hypothetical protein
MLAYPPSVPAPPSGVSIDGLTNLGNKGGTNWALTKLPRDRGPEVVGLTSELRDAVSKRDRLTAQWERIQTELKKGGNDGRRTKELNREKSILQQPLENAKARVQQLESFRTGYGSAVRILQHLATCPICHQKLADFHPRDEDCFIAQCRSDSCKAYWELRLDRDTRSRIPVLLPGCARPESWPSQLSTRWVDEELGCDVLAPPVMNGDRDRSFLKPRTSRSQ